MNNIRVRIAPSPTGNLHLGTARAALFNYLFAMKNEGRFILRIEDTDLERSDKKYEQSIFDGLKWLGIKADEGVNEGGEYGPYRQTKRIDIYKKYLKKLLNEGKAYHCFCTKEELEEDRKKAMKEGEAYVYSGKCSDLPQDVVSKRLKAGEKSIIRFKVEEGAVAYNDLIRGKTSFDSKLIGDLSIAKDENTPLYNFAVVVDDYEMKISHVIRGEDHISNTPKQILIQKALGFPQPEYAHLPLILGPDKSKLSKRHGATSVIEFDKQGYLPEAMINFMALLGWNPKDEREIFSLKDLEKVFDLKNVGKSGAIFNTDKLNQINSEYIRAMSDNEYIKKSIKYLLLSIKGLDKYDSDYVSKAVLLEKERIIKFDDIGEATSYFFTDKLKYDKELLRWKNSSNSDTKDNLKKAHDLFSGFKEEDFDLKKLEEKTFAYLKKEGIGNGDFLWPLRVALCGRKNSPSPFEIASVLKREKTLKRVVAAIKLLS